MDPRVAATTTAVKAMLDLLARCDPNDDDEDLRLYWLLPSERRLCEHGFLSLLVASKLGKGQQQSVFVAWAGADAADDDGEFVSPGRLLKPCRGSTPGSARPFIDDVDLASHLAHISPEWNVRRVAYVPQEGSLLKVVSLREIDVEALRAAEREAQEAEAAVRVAKHAEADAAVLPVARGRGRCRRAGRAGRGGAARGRGQKRSHSETETVAGQAGEGPAGDAGVDAAAGEQDDPGPEEVDLALEEVPLPRRDPDTGRVFDAENKYIGAIRITKAGEPGSFISVYCSAHTCSKVYRANRKPSTLGLLQWFARGLCQKPKRLTQSEHLRLMDSFAFGEA